MDTRELEQLYRDHAGQLLGSLMRTFHDLDLCEELVHEAVVVAIERWPTDGTPDQPVAWLLTVARRRGVDRVRRQAVGAAKTELAGRSDAALELSNDPLQPVSDEHVEIVADDQLRLLFLCCHPSLAPEAQVALTLRAVAGLQTGEIASAFVLDEATMAQRLVRAKRKIKLAGIPFTMPDRTQLADRLDVVLRIIYLVFNEGYAATDGDEQVRRELTTEAIRLGRRLLELMPDEPDVLAVVGLMLLHDSRRSTRTSTSGDLVLLADQDRSKWDRAQIDEGTRMVDRSFGRGRVRNYQVEGAIAALHASAASSEQTDWPQIAELYGVLERVAPSAVVTLNRAVAVAMATSPQAGLELADAVARSGAMDRSHRLHATRAELLRQSSRFDEAADAYRRALQLVGTEPERRYLTQRLAELNLQPGPDLPQ
ncbi:MAG: polymerase subunit sigma-24 [Ilumatobacteraceae bacterium]|nr:polymerase subunit sigma-24 [Ilumatobacteraceae bacterium]